MSEAELSSSIIFVLFTKFKFNWLDMNYLKKSFAHQAYEIDKKCTCRMDHVLECLCVENSQSFWQRNGETWTAVNELKVGQKMRNKFCIFLWVSKVDLTCHASVRINGWIFRHKILSNGPILSNLILNIYCRKDGKEEPSITHWFMIIFLFFSLYGILFDIKKSLSIGWVVGKAINGILRDEQRSPPSHSCICD